MDHVYDDRARARARIEVAIEYPDILDAIAEGGAFGGDYSVEAAVHMFSERHAGAITDLRAKTRVIEVAPHCYSVRLPRHVYLDHIADAHAAKSQHRQPGAHRRATPVAR